MGATKKDLVEDIRSITGCKGYISRTKIAEYCGISRNNKDKLMEITKGCRSIPTGRGPEYSVLDVAENLSRI